MPPFIFAYPVSGVIELEIFILELHILIDNSFSEADTKASVTGSSMSEKYQLFCKICLAIGEQWLGNVVTMSHWYENWLLEGFNRILQASCVNTVGTTSSLEKLTKESPY